jgi:hypothetical protein
MMQRKNINLNVYLPAGTYYWYVQTIDTGLAKSNWSAVQSIVIGADTTPPIISSVGSSVTSSTATITWTTDETSNSSVYYGITTATTSFSGLDDLVTSHSITLNDLSASTLYYYNVSSCDYWGNCNVSVQHDFTTSAAPVTPSGGGGGGGGLTSATYIANENELSSGYTKELRKGDKIKFESKNKENHTLTVEYIGKNYTQLSIQSSPIKLALLAGEEKKLNMTSKDYYDLLIKLENIIGAKANVTIKTINEKITNMAGENIISRGENESSMNKTASQEIKKNARSRLLIWILTGVIIIILAAVIIYLVPKYKFYKLRKSIKIKK